MKVKLGRLFFLLQEYYKNGAKERCIQLPEERG
jgi:hypothetical protein